MKKEEKILIIQKIESEIKDTKQKIKEYKELSKPIPPENAIGRISRMDAINNKSVVEAALRESENKLEKLLIVKKQINKSDFGICIKCKTKMQVGRIMFRPQSIYCINCVN